ncbi:putative protein MSS51 homolog, mitochondrial [Prorops nasuta]|uniref:putative protein MSS51 homolog, mitochondrial n=1 Tax=Prorops nasuta TaxID=863751 RepID=UPI0034CFDC36
MGRKKNSNRKPARGTTIALLKKTESARDSDKDSPEGSFMAGGVPIDIYSRLSIPIIDGSTLRVKTNSSSDDSDEERLIFTFRPRFTFATNLCLVCMEVAEIVCESCKMVSYCSQQHKKQGRCRHKEFCKIFTELLGKGSGFSMAKGLSNDHYKLLRLKFMEIVEKTLRRRMELWEKEIILYPKVCRVCHDASSDIICCDDCKMEFYCVGHDDGHERWCRELEVLRRILILTHRNGFVTPEIPNFEQEIPVENFDKFIFDMYRDSLYYRYMDCHIYATLSHIATAPLTTLYSLRECFNDLRTLDKMTIHIIGAEFQFECNNLCVWEKFFLHFMPRLQILSLVFIGPELNVPDIPIMFYKNVHLCGKCKRSGRVVQVQFQDGMVYHEFTRSEEFSKPDIVCLFNPGLYRETAFNGSDTWPDTIREFCKFGVPVVITAYTSYEIPRDIERVRSICDMYVVCEPRKNPFASLKPDRNFVSEDSAPIIYKNYFMAVLRGKS